MLLRATTGWRVGLKRCQRRLQQALLFFALIHINPVALAYSDLVIFGDSLSDTGNVSQFLGYDLPFPYHENRISNGPVAVDVLADQLGLSAAHSGILLFSGEGNNYAISGANAAGSDLHDLPVQFQTFLADTDAPIDPEVLFIVMIGGNDVRDASVMRSPAESNTAIVAAVDSILLHINQLLDHGAGTIVIANAPDISSIPETSVRALTHPDLLNRAEQLSREFNDRLQAGIELLQPDPGVRLYLFDLFEHFSRIVESPGEYGFSNHLDPCFEYDSYSFHPQCDFDKFVFFDSIHPTARVHELLGLAMYETLQGGTGPMPGTLIIPLIIKLLLD